MLDTGSAAPDLALQDADGNCANLADYRDSENAVPDDRAAAAAWNAKHEVPFTVVTGRLDRGIVALNRNA